MALVWQTECKHAFLTTSAEISSVTAFCPHGVVTAFEQRPPSKTQRWLYSGPQKLHPKIVKASSLRIEPRLESRLKFSLAWVLFRKTTAKKEKLRDDQSSGLVLVVISFSPQNGKYVSSARKMLRLSLCLTIFHEKKTGSGSVWVWMWPSKKDFQTRSWASYPLLYWPLPVLMLDYGIDEREVKGDQSLSLIVGKSATVSNWTGYVIDVVYCTALYERRVRDWKSEHSYLFMVFHNGVMFCFVLFLGILSDAVWVAMEFYSFGGNCETMFRLSWDQLLERLRNLNPVSGTWISVNSLPVIFKTRCAETADWNTAFTPEVVNKTRGWLCGKRSWLLASGRRGRISGLFLRNTRMFWPEDLWRKSFEKFHLVSDSDSMTISSCVFANSEANALSLYFDFQ